MRSLSHSASGSRQGRSRKSGFPGRTSIWKRGAPLTLGFLSRPGSPVVGDDLDASRAGCACRATKLGVARRAARTAPPDHLREVSDNPARRQPMTAYRLPDVLEPLARLAGNLAWTWDEEIAGVLAEVDPDGLALASGNPIAMLVGASPARLEQLAADNGFLARLERAEARLNEHLSGPGWYETLSDAPAAIAYFSPEFGLSEALPQYSGGLGILAGDHLKAASDLAVPIVGVGLFYRNG